MLKIMTIAGTRPELIRLSRIIPVLDQLFSHVLVHTGQNQDAGLKDVFFSGLGLRQPDHCLNLDLQSPGRMLSGLLPEIERLVNEEKPGAALILGDTNSALACIILKKCGVPIYHMEAGNRCFDPESPEEINRRIVDHTCDFNLPYTEAARRNLLREGLHPRRIYLTGSPLCEVIQHYRENIRESDILEKLGLRERKFIAVSIHRQETVDHPERIGPVFQVLARLHREHEMPVIFSTHPRTRQKISQFGVSIPEGVRCIDPMGYFAWCRLQMTSACVVSDSGTVSEEAALLDFPAVSPRNAMERPEAMDCGNVVLCGLSPEAITSSVALMMARPSSAPRTIPAEYRVPDVSHRVAALIAGTCRLSRVWA